MIFRKKDPFKEQNKQRKVEEFKNKLEGMSNVHFLMIMLQEVDSCNEQILNPDSILGAAVIKRTGYNPFDSADLH